MSEPLSILLHAAARGARLQTRYGYGAGGWQPTSWRNINDYHFRIDPRDRHLRYGPISRVLFEAAENPPEALHLIFEFAEESEEARESAYIFSWGYLPVNGPYYASLTRDARSFFLLFVAEALAHEGL